MKVPFTTFEVKRPAWLRRPDWLVLPEFFKAEPLPAQPLDAPPSFLPDALGKIGHTAFWVSCFFLALYTIQQSGALDLRLDYVAAESEGLAGRFVWAFKLSTHVFNAVGLFGASVIIAAINAYWIPAIATLPRKFRASRWTMAAIGLLTSGAIVIGTFTTLHGGRVEKARDYSVKLEENDKQKAKLETDIGDLKAKLQIMREGDSVEAKAAKAGSESWAAKVAAARTQSEILPSMLDRMVRAQTDADEASRIEKAIAEKNGEVAGLKTQAELAERVAVTGEEQVTSIIDTLNSFRSPIIAALTDLIAALAFLWRAAFLRAIAEAKAEAPPTKTESKEETDDPPPKPDAKGFKALPYPTDEEFAAWRARFVAKPTSQESEPVT